MLIAASIAALAIITWKWSADSFGPLPSVLPVVLAAVSGAVGLQNVFGGFVLAIIGGHAPILPPRRSSRFRHPGKSRLHESW